MKRLMTLFAVALLLLNVSCSSRETVVTGEAFVVTQGAGNYKLGLVEIFAISEKDMLGHVAAKNNDPAIEGQKQKFEAAKIAYDRSQEAFDKAGKRLDERKASYENTKSFDSVDSFKNSMSKFDDVRWSLDERVSLAGKVDSSKLVRDAERLKLNEMSSGSIYFETLPKPVATATTNSDGQFTLKIPQKGKYALVAKATRNVVGSDEVYYWAVWFDAVSGEQTFTFSNNNKTDSAFPQSIVTTAQY